VILKDSVTYAASRSLVDGNLWLFRVVKLKDNAAESGAVRSKWFKIPRLRRSVTRADSRNQKPPSGLFPCLAVKKLAVDSAFAAVCKLED
jgi:hypothetical protein